MEVDEIPDFSGMMNEIHHRYLESGANADVGLGLVQNFIAKYPYYPEAYIFKSTILIAVGRYKQAINCLRIAKKIDKWRTFYSFNEAEALFKLNLIDKSIEALDFGIKSFLQDLLTGVDDFLSGIVDDPDKSQITYMLFIEQLEDYINSIKKNYKTEKYGDIETRSFALLLEKVTEQSKDSIT